MIPILFIIQGILFRLLPHLPNAAPITAMGLFGGAKLSKRMAILLPFATMVLSDYLLLYVHPFETPGVVMNHIYPISALVHSTTLYVWGSFLLSSMIGMTLRNHQKVWTITASSLLCSCQFFLITNFGVWMAGHYGAGWSGLLKSYAMGLPFLQGTILGDLAYTGVFFGLFHLAVYLARHTRTQVMLPQLSH